MKLWRNSLDDTASLWDGYIGSPQGTPVEHNGFMVHMDFAVPVTKGEPLLFVIESSRGAWPQGICLTVKGTVECEGETLKKGLGLWADTLPRKGGVVRINAKDGQLWITNVWLTGIDNQGPMARMHNSGMVVEPLRNGWRFRCSDGYGTKPLSSLRTPRDFNNLVFRIERLANPDEQRVLG